MWKGINFNFLCSFEKVFNDVVKWFRFLNEKDIKTIENLG